MATVVRNFDEDDLVPDRRTMLRIGGHMADRMEKIARERARTGNFGPASTETSRYSTAAHFFSLTDPQDAGRRFVAEGRADPGDRFVDLEGGYQEFREIYKGDTSTQVNLNLTGEMLRSMQGIYSIEGTGTDVRLRIGLSFKDSSSEYGRTTAAERAEYVNRQHQFMHVSDRQADRMIRLAAAKAGVRL